ncbi:unnamed protein product [Effrenium voratum]|uniref:Uncharacterized protein n=1 Tax=Effrenium voratum TaxID=2562239 RepID=A0AA36MUQ2_9DINO|nr:unnamed protein product [Effrenium voratum]CAJ1457613.1 unnamed protein product [Effrenium voratum]
MVAGDVNGASNGNAGKPCIQCRRPPPAGPARAAFGAPVARLVFGACLHGPFCETCRGHVARCTLPACVCRVLLEGWREAPWPPAGPEDRSAPQARASVCWLQSLEVKPRHGLQPAQALASAAADEQRMSAPEAQVAPSFERNAVFKKREAREEKFAFRYQKRTAAPEAEAELTAAQVAAAVAAEASSKGRLIEDSHPKTAPAKFQAQLTAPKDKGKSSGPKAKKPRLIAAGDSDSE